MQSFYAYTDVGISQTGRGQSGDGDGAKQKRDQRGALTRDEHKCRTKNYLLRT
jgi:hypothetical protein